jgi:hypothetical protein
MGEPPFPPIFGALANALYKATGKRVYRQPFLGERAVLEQTQNRARDFNHPHPVSTAKPIFAHHGKTACDNSSAGSFHFTAP